MKYKILLLLALTVIFASKCTKDEEVPIVYFDHVTQAQKDNDSILQYLQTHFINEAGVIDTVNAGQIPLIDYPNLVTQIVHHKWDYTDDAHDVEIDYKLYYIILEQGINEQPTKVDSAHVSYKGTLLNGTLFDENIYGTWLTLNAVVKGMSYGLEHFKSGDFYVNPDQSLGFTNVGKGILIMPSGLGYADQSQTKIPANSPLVFYINLNMVNRTDWDSDGIDSFYEDLNHNGIFTDDNTDGDSYQDYLDADDDGDGVLTKNEHSDPNGDHNPSDAEDANSNNIPDYLDPLTK